MDFEIRADGVLHIEGYVNAVERDSRIVMCPECGKCVEQIAAGAFGNALRAAKNVDMLLNHDKGRKIGSTSEGTLTLAEDSIGLRASADITDEEVVEKARNGLLRGWSFGFKATDTEIEQRSQGVPRRHVKALSISEVSLVDSRYRPCYAGTSIELRADEEGAEEADFTELRFNPYHDPNTGRFTDSSGGGTGGVLFSKGGKSAYVVADSEFTDKPAKNDNAAKSQNFIKNNEQLIKETQRLSVHYAESLKNNDLEKDEYDELIAELPRNITANQRFTVSDSNGSYLISGTTFEIGNEKYGYFTTNRTNEFVADLSGSGKAIHVSEHDDRGNKLYSIPDKLSSTARTLKNIREVVNRAEPDISDALPDYSAYEARLARVRMRELELRAEELELRFNPYHDPTNGRFTTANGGGSGSGFLYSKGGKSAYVFERDIDSEYEAWTKSKAAKASHNADRNFKLDAFLREKHNNMTDANNVVSARDVEDYINYKIGMHNIWLSTNLSVGSKTYDRPAKIDFNLGKSIDIMVDNTPAAAKGIEEAFSDLKKAGFEVKKIPDSYYDKKFYNITRKKGTRTSVWEKDMPERFDHIKRRKEAYDWNSPTNWRSP